MTTTEDNTALIRRMEEEIFNKRHVDAIDEFISPEYALRTAPKGAPAGRDAVRESMSMYLAGFPDLHVSVDELLAVDDKVVARLTYTGTHSGELFGMSPTQRRVAVHQFAIYRISDGKVVEEWEISDQLGLMQQLGVIPE